MNIWLIITPAIIWFIAATWGLSLIRRPADELWKSHFLTRTTPPAYDGSTGQRVMVAFARSIGWTLFASAIFITIMALLVAVGVVPPAKN